MRLYVCVMATVMSVSVSSGNDVVEIDQLRTTFVNAINARDSDAAASYVPTSDWITADGTIHRGRAEIKAATRVMFDRSRLRIGLTPSSVRLLNSTNAMEDGESTISEGETVLHGRYTLSLIEVGPIERWSLYVATQTTREQIIPPISKKPRRIARQRKPSQGGAAATRPFPQLRAFSVSNNVRAVAFRSERSHHTLCISKRVHELAFHHKVEQIEVMQGTYHDSRTRFDLVPTQAARGLIFRNTGLKEVLLFG